MADRIVYAVHVHQKQRNAHEADELVRAEAHYQAVYIFLEMAQDYGITREELGPLYYEDLDVLPEIDVGPSVLRFLRSDEWDVSDLEETDEEDSDGELDFVLHNRLAKDVEQRHVRLIQYRFDPSFWPYD